MKAKVDGRGGGGVFAALITDEKWRVTSPD